MSRVEISSEIEPSSSSRGRRKFLEAEAKIILNQRKTRQVLGKDLARTDYETGLVKKIFLVENIEEKN